MKHTLLSVALLLSTATVIARPAYPGVLYATLQDGTRVAYHVTGDEFAHACVTLDGRFIEPLSGCEDDLACWHYVDKPVAPSEHPLLRPLAPTRQPMGASAEGNPYTSFPTVGEVKGLVLMVNFTDKKFLSDNTPEFISRQLNEPGFNHNGATGSARDYFIDQSSGLFTPQFDVIGPVELPHNMAYYGANYMGQDLRPGQMVTDACQYAHDSLSIDFSQYDYDNDGNVDFVFCLYAGFGENYGASSNTIWPHMSRLTSQYIYYSLDGKNIDLYACSCELMGVAGNHRDGIGAVCHEFGHVLGLPDIYNTSMQGLVQLGSWCIMDSGSYNNVSRTPASYTAFERHQLGWLDFIELTEPLDSVVVPELTQNNVAYRITTPHKPNEFFTLENHQQVGWDRYQGGRGLMIIHVTYEADAWHGNYVNSSLFPHYDLIEADGTAGRTLETDLYPIAGNDLFTDYSNPNSLSWDKTPTNQGVTRIRQHDDGNISFRFMNDRLRCPELLAATQITDSSFCAQWTNVEGAIGYRMHLLEELPDSLNPLLLAEDFSLLTEGAYPSSDSQNMATDLNDFMHTYGWSGEQLYSCGGMIRLGGYGKSGQLTTPRLTPPSDSLTVSLSCCAYTGKSVNYEVILLDGNGDELQKEAFKAKRDIQTPVIRFGNVPNQVRVKIASNKERLFIDDLRIGQGDIDSLTLWTAGPREWELLCEPEGMEAALAEDVVVTYTVTGLLPGRTYQYDVTALDAEPLRNSVVSQTQVVTLLLDTGIEQICTDRPASDRIYDLHGRYLGTELNNLPEGFYIVGGHKIKTDAR